MNLPAMARVTKIPLDRLQELSKTSAVFAPGGRLVAFQIRHSRPKLPEAPQRGCVGLDRS